MIQRSTMTCKDMKLGISWYIAGLEESELKAAAGRRKKARQCCKHNTCAQKHPLPLFVDAGAVIEYCFKYVGRLPRCRLFVFRTVLGTMDVFMRILQGSRIEASVAQEQAAGTTSRAHL